MRQKTDWISEVKDLDVVLCEEGLKALQLTLAHAAKRCSPTRGRPGKPRTIVGIIEHRSKKLTKSKNPEELVAAVRDACYALRELFIHCNMSHVDVSPMNVQFRDRKAGKAMGVLYDFDHYTKPPIKPRVASTIPSHEPSMVEEKALEKKKVDTAPLDIEGARIAEQEVSAAAGNGLQQKQAPKGDLGPNKEHAVKESEVQIRDYHTQGIHGVESGQLVVWL